MIDLTRAILLVITIGACSPSANETKPLFLARAPAEVASGGSPTGESSAGHSPSMTTSREDLNALLETVVPFARQSLARYREFYPFGATMSPSGEIALAAAYDGREHPPAADVIALLKLGFRSGATSTQFKATALVLDVFTTPPGSATKQDAIAVHLDHCDGRSVVVTFPYSFSEDGELVVQDPFTGEGAKDIFPS